MWHHNVRVRSVRLWLGIPTSQCTRPGAVYKQLGNVDYDTKSLCCPCLYSSERYLRGAWRGALGRATRGETHIEHLNSIGSGKLFLTHVGATGTDL